MQTDRAPALVSGPASSLLPRRELLRSFLAAFAVAALVREARAAGPPGDRRVRVWIDSQQAIAEGLATGRISGPQWAAEVERLSGEVDVAELMAAVRRAQIAPAGRGSHNDPHKSFVRFLDDEGQVRRLAYGTALFAFDPANVITPHGHRHMVSAHLVVGGRFRVRNFDRLGDADGGMIVRPTRDRIAEAGQVSTMCSERDNVHWFVPVGGPATTFDVVISGLDAGAPDPVVQAIDPLRARPLGDGRLLAPFIGFAEASRRYTADL
jgi:hypothetical protein